MVMEGGVGAAGENAICGRIRGVVQNPLVGATDVVAEGEWPLIKGGEEDVAF